MKEDYLMSMHPPFEIPCPHAKAGADPRLTYPDHHPLTMGELREVLEFAFKNRKNAGQAQAQVRLTQAVKDMSCPPPDQGATSKASHRLSNVFVDWLRSNKPVDEVIDRIAELIVISN